MRRLTLVIAVAALAGCMVKVPPELEKHYTGHTLYTCCNLYYQGDQMTDANYRDGEMLPLGTPVSVTELGPNSITFNAEGKVLTLKHLYGTQQEAYKQYFDKVLVEANRAEMVANFPPIIRKAIEDGRVEPGMKRGEVVLSVGFPPTDDNLSPEATTWKFWYSKGRSYSVVFDANGYVSDVVGEPAPTRGKPVRVYGGVSAE
jgi:hypothetical protein